MNNIKEIKINEEKTIMELFNEQVKKTPDHTAIIFENEKVSYNELDKRANSLAITLREYGIQANSIVAILADRSIEMIVSIIATLKVGATYVPLDSEYPQKRIKYILEDSKAQLILAQGNLMKKIKIDIEVLNLDEEYLYRNEDVKIRSVSNKNDLAYIIYTSGTTGNPKGVMIENGSLVNYILYAKKNYLNEKNMYMPLYTSISFDLTVTTIFTPLISGNTIVVYKDKEIDILMKKVFQENIDLKAVIKVTPAHLSLLKELLVGKNTIKKLIVGGEALKEDLAKKISLLFKHKIEIINEYGPTEATVGCVVHKYDYNNVYEKTVLVGKAIDNFEIYILNKENELITDNSVGEICISGKGVARGYLNNDKLNQEKFIKINSKNNKIYKTGDLGRFLKDGNLECLGRIDEQVKIRGFRIELEEIESVIGKLEGVKEVIAIVRENKLNIREINAYVISDDLNIIEKINSKIKEYLPEYMIPSKYMIIDKIPLTLNGKIDKSLLPEIEMEIKVCMPTNPLEEEILSLWKKMLDIDEIGIDDNFLEVGGHSLIATRMVYKINEIYNIELSLVEFLTMGLNVRDLSELIEEKLFDSMSDEELACMLDEIEN